MKPAALACLTACILLALTSFFYDPPLARGLPVAQVEERLTPLPFSLPLQYAVYVIRAGDATGVPIWILCRLYAWESGWRSDFRSRMNADGTRDLGIAGLNSANVESKTFARQFNGGKWIDASDAETSIMVGARYLVYLYALTGTWYAAVGCYNVGYWAWQRGDRPVRHLAAIMEGTE